MRHSVASHAAGKTSTATANSSSARGRAARRRIDDEHRQLGELLRALGHAHDFSRVVHLLDELRDLLVRHFAGEEGADGRHRVVEDGASHRLTNLQQLFEEHGVLIARLDQLRGDAEATLAGPVRRVHEGIAALAETLRRHEKDEEALFGEAFYSDLGRS